MQLIKRILFRVLGQQRYLQCLHLSFHWIYRLGLLKNNEVYKYHYWVKQLIQPGNTVLDLGSNLGYYTRIFSDLVGKHGNVIAIEPVKPFFEVQQKFLGDRKNITLYNHALGESNKTIEMVIPKMDSYIRTGLAHVKTEAETEPVHFSFQVDMVKGSELLANLHELHYIKCDIEGYESIVIPEIIEVIRKHHPIIQIETFGETRKNIKNLLTPLGYEECILHQDKLHKTSTFNLEKGDVIFIPKEKVLDLLG
jgi:FkbM family methyltransferase